MRALPSWFLAAGLVMTLTAPARADDALPVQFHRLLPVGQLVIDHTRYPSATQAVGVGSLRLGSTFELEAPQVHAYFAEADALPASTDQWTCRLQGVVPLMDCDLIGPRAGALAQAFGEDVTVQIQVLLDRPLTPAQIAARRFGSGRIITVVLHTLHPSPQFNERALAYFNQDVHAAPTSRGKFTAPDAVYSPPCLATIDRVFDAGPAASAQDQQAQRTCEAQALEAVRSGTARSGRLVEYRWSQGDQRVTLSSSEMPSMPASADDPVELRAVESQVYMGLIGDMGPYKAAIARLQSTAR